MNLDDLFAKSIELIKEHKVHAILYDSAVENDKNSIIPNHYGIVVGYNKSGGKKRLVVNKGWGNNFEIIDCTDPRMQPAKIYWLDMKSAADGPRDAHRIGPSGGYNFDGSANRLDPVITRTNGELSLGWPVADSTVFLYRFDPRWAVSFSEWR